MIDDIHMAVRIAFDRGHDSSEIARLLDLDEPDVIDILDRLRRFRKLHEHRRDYVNRLQDPVIRLPD